MCFNFIISMAAKCSEVWGCGQGSLPAEKDKAITYTESIN